MASSKHQNFYDFNFTIISYTLLCGVLKHLWWMAFNWKELKLVTQDNCL